MTAATFLHGVELIEVDAGPRPIKTVNSAVIALIGTAPNASALDFPYNTPVLLTGSRTQAAKLRDASGSAGGGTLADAVDSILDQAGALIVVIRVATGQTEAETRANVLGSSSAGTGIYAFLHAESITGFTPRILVAPGFTDYKPADPVNEGEFLPNPTVTSLITVAKELKAVIMADAPAGSSPAEATAYAADFGSDRVFATYPAVLRTDKTGAVVSVPASSGVAGILARTDYEQGFWKSPSNEPFLNILGPSKPIAFSLSSPTSQANVLNEGKVATIVRQAGGGFLLWGNRTTSSDPRYQFLAVRRTADMINDSIVRAHQWAVDKGITRTYTQDVVEGINAYLRTLKTLGAIIDGKAWCDPDLNPAAQVEQGIVVFCFDFTPPYSAEHVIIRSQLTNAYLTEIF